MGRMRRRFAVASAAAMLAGSAAGQGVYAQSLLMEVARPQGSPPDADIETFTDWQIAWSADAARNDTGAEPTCILRPQPGPFARSGDMVSLGGRKITLPGQETASMLFVLKTRQGLLLPEGVGLQVDRRPAQRLAYHSCDRGTCAVPFVLTKSLRAAFEKGGQLRLTVVTGQKAARSVSVSLHGFTAAMKAFERVRP